MVQGEPIRGVLVDKDSIVIEAVTIKDCLEEYYRILDCDLIDCTHRVIGGVVYDLVCDDNGLNVDKPIPTAIDGNKEVALVGNLFIVRRLESGEWESLTDADVENILRHAYLYKDIEGNLRPLIKLDGPYGMGAPAEDCAEAESE